MNEFYYLYCDFGNVIDYLNAFLLRDLINIEYKESKGILISIVRELFYDEEGFTEVSNPKTHERVSKALINMIEGENPFKEIYEEVVVSFNNLKSLITEKGIGEGLC